MKHGYWPHIANEDCRFFTDLAFLVEQISNIPKRNLLGVYRNPPTLPPSPGPATFEFLGYDLVEVQGSISALTNCGGFPDVFDNAELSLKGLLTSHARACEVQSHLRLKHPEEPHADCHVWAIFRAVGESIHQARA
jgi:hypothetical protein